MIEDREMLELFKAESAEHLKVLEQDLTLLETEPENSETLERIFREAHSLKGAARMLGISKIEMLAHRFEDLLGSAHRGDLKLDVPTIEALYMGLDALRKLVDEEVSGQPSKVDVPAIMEALSNATNTVGHTARDTPQVDAKSPKVKGAPKPRSSSKKVVKKDTPVTEPIPEMPENIGEPSGVSEDTTTPENTAKPKRPPAPSSDQEDPKQRDYVVEPNTEAQPFRISTIRVSTDHLDTLMNYTDELTVTKLRIARRLTEFEELLFNWEEWSAEAQKTKKIGIVSGDRESLDRDASVERERFCLDLIGTSIATLKNSAFADATKLESVANAIEESVRTVRMLPLTTMLDLFPSMVRSLAKAQGKKIKLVIHGGEIQADKQIIEEMKDPLMHLIRNCIDHGVELPDERAANNKSPTGKVVIEVSQRADHVTIKVSDDGRGIDQDVIKRAALKKRIVSEANLADMSSDQILRLILSSGFSTSTMITDISGRGVGLDVVSKNVENMKGTITISSEVGKGSQFTVKIPVTLATFRALIVNESGYQYALPVDCIHSMITISPRKIFPVEGRSSIMFGAQPIPVAFLSEILELNLPHGEAHNDNVNDKSKALFCIIIEIGGEHFGVFVEDIESEQEIVLKRHCKLLERVRNVSGSSILGTGSICVVLNPNDIWRSLQNSKSLMPETSLTDTEEARKIVLLVEDSITTRTQEKRVLEAAGYDVITAVNGVDGFNKLNQQPFDAVVSDIQMPEMDGLSLAEKIRSETKYKVLPIILVTSLASDDDKKRGLDAGADAYITKGSFDQNVLLDTLRRLIA